MGVRAIVWIRGRMGMGVDVCPTLHRYNIGILLILLSLVCIVKYFGKINRDNIKLDHFKMECFVHASFYTTPK